MHKSLKKLSVLGEAPIKSTREIELDNDQICIYLPFGQNKGSKPGVTPGVEKTSLQAQSQQQQPRRKSSGVPPECELSTSQKDGH